MNDIDRMDVVGWATITSMVSVLVAGIITYLVLHEKIIGSIVGISCLVIAVIGGIALQIAYRKEIKDIDDEYKKKLEELLK